MRKDKLLIADASEEFCDSLCQEVGKMYQIRCCGSGTDALKYIRSFQPDVVVMELMLPYMDGITVLQKLREEGCQAQILVVTSMFNGYVAKQLQDLGVGYVLQKPCSIRAVRVHLQELKHFPKEALALPDAADRLPKLLLPLGVSPKHKGYLSLREAILLVLRDPEISFSKELYPVLAETAGTSARCEERRIRIAIEGAWKQRDEEIWSRFFPKNDGIVAKPSNARFITTMAEALRQMQ